VINIGRRPDNQLVVDDPRVSRVHSQLRAIKGRFVIFDLDSTGGTYVNSQRINQYTLYPGDVISLAGYPLVYGQDSAGPGQTQKYIPGEEEKD
jgi:pSer/pThr/pTyr-binding forkhead associated (FHA) protein